MIYLIYFLAIFKSLLHPIAPTSIYFFNFFSNFFIIFFKVINDLYCIGLFNPKFILFLHISIKLLITLNNIKKIKIS